jgi:DNA (cytosine-5)-methyltransferase 1
MRAPVSEMTPYVIRLNQAWIDHQVPRMDDAPTVISLFAGGGGSSLGYGMAGFRELLAVEWNPHAAATFRSTFPDVPLVEGDINDLTTERCLQLAGIAPSELDVLDGSPPCQGFSTSGKRILDDPRNDLFRAYVRLLRGIRPKVLVMENVSGLVKGKMRLVFAEIMQELKASGYRVSARLLNAMYFGVPQARERIIVIGVRNDLGATPSHPRAITWPTTVREALDDVASEQVPELTPKYRALAPLIRPGQCAADVDRGKGFQNLVRLRLDRPAPTLTRMNPGHGRGTHLHPIYHRSLSIPEAKRLCAFPDAFVLAEGSFQDRWAVLGNAVPPLFMRAIARHIRRELLDRVGDTP